ncbi:unnamed protein product [Spirodela intermedia]|uniref:Uncharacterized protein n=1 Tax=Spirodela intermedia TaxID=51605 RepID=A0A7I8J978_SPIIN|nr:unnamed protein product [Spirodela intermedia]CAA6666541.1 unnamed protein product [Spirodela intermedia]
MAALSLTPSNLSHVSSSRHRRHNVLLLGRIRPLVTSTPKSTRLKQISAGKLPFSPPPSPPGELYQPFRPPPSPIPPKYRSLDPAERLEVLRNRLGLWYEYASLIPPCLRRGISGVEQNCLIVAAQVRDSLQSSKFDPDLLAYFDSGGSELLYELRLLSASQRVAAARQVVEGRLDAKAAQELARAMKDFPRRQSDDGWDSFSRESPGDCLAFSYFRQSREAISDSERRVALEKALEAVETEVARKRLEQELEKKAGGADAEEAADEVSKYSVPVVRMKYGEVAEATSVVVLPVSEAGEGDEGVATAPACRTDGDFGVLTADKAWRRWVVLPRWDPLASTVADEPLGAGGAGAGGGDRTRKVVEEEGFYLVSRVGGMAVERGSKLLEMDVEALGTVVLVVRPQRTSSTISCRTRTGTSDRTPRGGAKILSFLVFCSQLNDERINR